MLFDIGYVTSAKSINDPGAQSQYPSDEVSMFKALLGRPFNTPAKNLFAEEGALWGNWIPSLQVDAITPSFFLLAKESR